LEEKGLSDKVTPYLGKITRYDDPNEQTSCYDSCGFSIEDFKYFSEINAAATDSSEYMHRFPQGKANYCTADSFNSFVIGADGSLYKCWRDVGNLSRRTGSLLDPSISNGPVYLGYMLSDPTISDKCSKCNILPVCGGGCPERRLSNDDDKCSIYSFVLEDFLKVISQKLKAEKESG
jgi:uncharacterized protein